MIDYDKATMLDELLKKRGESRTNWFRRKIDEELEEKK